MKATDRDVLRAHVARLAKSGESTDRRTADALAALLVEHEQMARAFAAISDAAARIDRAASSWAKDED